jgi:hypothetical protein
MLLLFYNKPLPYHLMINNKNKLSGPNSANSSLFYFNHIIPTNIALFAHRSDKTFITRTWR